MLAVFLIFASSVLGANPPGSGESKEPAAPLDSREAGLRGLIYNQGRWVSPDELVGRDLENARLSNLRTEYSARREKTPGTARGQRELALWCEASGLKAESLAHFLVVTRLDPDDHDARQRLGMRLDKGSWRTEAEIAADAIEAEAQSRADRIWGPKIATWRKWLREPDHKAEAVISLAQIHDPRAVAALRESFGDRDTWEQDWAVKLFGRIDAPRSSQILAELSVFGLDKQVRGSATKKLVHRDPRTFVGLLINWFHEPVHYEFAMKDGSGLLRVEGDSAIVERFYAPTISNGSTTGIGQASGTKPTSAMIQGMKQAVRNREKMDVLAIERTNFQITQTNERVEQTLKAVTGMDFGKEQQPWTAWWTAELGYSYESPQPPSPKPVIEESVQVTYVSPPPPLASTPIHHACFGAGTPVFTRVGPRPIEDLRVGDQVLTQDSNTGELYFRPILTVFHNKPTATLRVVLEGETIIATGIHRFWKAGQGWAMARELRPGDRVRTVGGQSEVLSVEPDKVQPVYNLEVPDGHSYFVGNHRALVHDNSLVAPVTTPFDAEVVALKAATR